MQPEKQKQIIKATKSKQHCKQTWNNSAELSGALFEGSTFWRALGEGPLSGAFGRFLLSLFFRSKKQKTKRTKRKKSEKKATRKCDFLPGPGKKRGTKATKSATSDLLGCSLFCLCIFGCTFFGLFSCFLGCSLSCWCFFGLLTYFLFFYRLFFQAC